MRFIYRYRRVCDCAVRAFINAQTWQGKRQEQDAYRRLVKRFGVTRTIGTRWVLSWKEARRRKYKRVYQPNNEKLDRLLERGSAALVGGLWDNGKKFCGHMVFVYDKTPKGYLATGIGGTRKWMSKRQFNYKMIIRQMYEVPGTK